MRVAERELNQLRERGYMTVEGFLSGDELAEAQEALWLHFPRPDEYFDNPEPHAHLVETQFTGNRRGPWAAWALNRLAFHPDLLDAAERFLGSSDLRLYKTELWAKYSGSVDYDQALHRDYGNHSLVVPKVGEPTQMTSFLLLSDVTEQDGPTKVVSLEDGSRFEFVPRKLAMGEGVEVEVPVIGPAGTLFSYRTDVLHRGSAITGERRARFTLLADYEVWGPRWTGKVSWADHALGPEWNEMMERATPREREVFGFPSIGDAYWDDQTLADVAARYPGMDMAPYTDGASMA